MNEKDLEKEITIGVYSKRPVMKCIKLKCLDCCGGSWEQVKNCACKDDCFLHPYRLGTNPFLKRSLTEEQRQAAAERLRSLRKK